MTQGRPTAQETELAGTRLQSACRSPEPKTGPTCASMSLRKPDTEEENEPLDSCFRALVSKNSVARGTPELVFACTPEVRTTERSAELVRRRTNIER